MSWNFEVNGGLKQGDISPILFNLALENVIKKMKVNPGGTLHNRISIQGRHFGITNEFKYLGTTINNDDIHSE